MRRRIFTAATSVREAVLEGLTNYSGHKYDSDAALLWSYGLDREDTVDAVVEIAARLGVGLSDFDLDAWFLSRTLAVPDLIAYFADRVATRDRSIRGELLGAFLRISVPVWNLNDSDRLVEDLGVDGGRARHLIDDVHERTGRDAAAFPFETYFTADRGSWPTRLLYLLRNRLSRPGKEPLSVGQLVALLEGGPDPAHQR